MNLKSFLAPPVFDDEEKTKMATMLNSSWWFLFSLIIFFAISNFMPQRVFTFSTAIDILFLLIWLWLRSLIQSGAIKQASVAALSYGAITVTIYIFRLGTVQSPVLVGYITVIIFAGILFGEKGAWRATAGSSLLILGLILAERSNLLIKLREASGTANWILYIGLYSITSYLVVIFYNNSQHQLKRAKEEIEKRKEIESTLRIYSRAIEQSPVSVVITNTDGEIETVNPKFLELTGYTIEEAYHQNPRILRSGKHPAAFYKDLWDTLLAGQNWYGEFYNQKKNGEYYWEHASISPVFSEKNKISHFVAIKEDITAQKEAKEALSEANQELETQLLKIQSLQKKLQEQATRDPLTGLYNRRYMEEVLEKECARAKRGNHPLSVILVDLDFLKKLNDIGGHATGDYALRSIAKHLNESTREEDTVVRYGGDEFTVILPNTTGENALMRTKEWQQEISKKNFTFTANQELKITFTAGIATYPTHGQKVEEIFDCADKALYQAKEKGRNRVELYLDRKSDEPQL